MKTFLIRFAITLTVLTGLWFAFSRIPVTESLDHMSFGDFNEEKFGELAMDAVLMESKEVKSDSVDKAMNILVTRLASGNLFPSEKFHIHVINNNEVNAFALPGNHVVVHTGLIYSCDNPEELAGVLAHEIAHLEKRHVIERMRTEGIITLLEGAVAQGGGATVASAVGELAGLAFSRDQENEADEVGFVTPIGYSPANTTLQVKEGDDFLTFTTQSNLPGTWRINSIETRNNGIWNIRTGSLSSSSLSTATINFNRFDNLVQDHRTDHRQPNHKFRLDPKHPH
jgi:hypothetical protein